MAGWVGAVGLLWLVGGVFLGGAGVGLAVLAHRRPRAVHLVPWVGVGLLALVPVSRLLQGLAPPSQVSASLVTGGASEGFALLGIALVVVGVLAVELPRSAEPRP